MSFTVLMVVLTSLIAISSVPILVWMERRVAGLIQHRLGPNRTNAFGIRAAGLVQGIADMIKLLMKEEYMPSRIKHRTIFFYRAGYCLCFGVSHLYGHPFRWRYRDFRNSTAFSSDAN